MTPRQGKVLEELVTALEKALSDSSDVTVHSPMVLPDRTTGRSREHDVVLEITQGHHSVLVAMECRDRSRPIGVPQVEAFWAKCQDTGINQGVIVSTAGFYNTAKKKADHLGIRCIDMEEVESFEWLLAPGFHVLTRHLLRNDWTFYPAEDGVVERGEFEVIDQNGNVATMAVLTANAQRQLTKMLPDVADPVEDAEVKVRFPGEGLFLRSTSTGKSVPVKYAIARLRYSVREELVPFRLVQYQEGDSDGHITDAAIADLTLGEKEAQMMIIYKQGEGGQVLLVPRKNKDA